MHYHSNTYIYMRRKLLHTLLVSLLGLVALSSYTPTRAIPTAEALQPRPDTLIHKKMYELRISEGKHTTEIRIVDQDSTHAVKEYHAEIYGRELKGLGRGVWHAGAIFGVFDVNATPYGTFRLLPKMYFGNTMMMGDAFAHAATPIMNHYLVAPVGYRYYIAQRFFLGLDVAFEGKSYSLRDNYYFKPDEAANALVEELYAHPSGLKRSKLVTRYISLPISIGVMPLQHSRMRIGLEVIPQFRYAEQVMHQQYGERHRERTNTHVTRPITLSYGAFLDFRPIGFYVQYTPQNLLNVPMEGYDNKGNLTVGFSINL